MLFSSHHLDEFVFTMSYKSRLSKVLVYMGKNYCRARVARKHTHTHAYYRVKYTSGTVMRYAETSQQQQVHTPHDINDNAKRQPEKKSHSNLSMSSSNKIDFNVGRFFFLHFYTVCVCVWVCIEFRVLCVIWSSYILTHMGDALMMSVSHDLSFYFSFVIWTLREAALLIISIYLYLP